jgi:hypothetical protein
MLRSIYRRPTYGGGTQPGGPGAILDRIRGRWGTGAAVDPTDLDCRTSLETCGGSPPACCEVGATAIKSTACRSRIAEKAASKATATTTHAAERRQLTELDEETNVDPNRYRCPSRTSKTAWEVCRETTAEERRRNGEERSVGCLGRQGRR